MTIDARAAYAATMAAMREADPERKGLTKGRRNTNLTWPHLEWAEDYILNLRVDSPSRSEKVNRWLGWLQGVCEGRGILSRETIDAINRDHERVPNSNYEETTTVTKTTIVVVGGQAGDIPPELLQHIVEGLDDEVLSGNEIGHTDMALSPEAMREIMLHDIESMAPHLADQVMPCAMADDPRQALRGLIEEKARGLGATDADIEELRDSDYHPRKAVEILERRRAQPTVPMGLVLDAIGLDPKFQETRATFRARAIEEGLPEAVVDGMMDRATERAAAQAMREIAAAGRTREESLEAFGKWLKGNGVGQLEAAKLEIKHDLPIGSLVRHMVEVREPTEYESKLAAFSRPEPHGEGELTLEDIAPPAGIRPAEHRPVEKRWGWGSTVLSVAIIGLLAGSVWGIVDPVAVDHAFARGVTWLHHHAQ